MSRASRRHEDQTYADGIDAPFLDERPFWRRVLARLQRLLGGAS